MSYLIKLQTTPALFDSVLNNSKHGGTVYHSLSPNFHRPHLSFRNNELSSYASALKTMPLSKKVSKKEENVLHKERAIDLQKLLKIIKTNNPKSIRKKETTLLKRTPVLSEMFENNYNFDSTKSYDPNLLDYNLEVEKFFKECGSSENLQENDLNNLLFSKESQEMPNNQLKDNINHADDSYTSEDFRKPQQGINDKNSQDLQKNLNISKHDMYKCLKINKVDQLQSVKKLLSEPSPIQEEIQQSPKIKNVPLSHEKSVLKPKEKVNFQKNINFNTFSAYSSLYSKSVQMLHSSIDIYVTNDSVLKGFELLKNYRKKIIWNHLVEEEKRSLCDMYNTLLHGLSEKGKWTLMQEVNKWMALDNVKMNSESFAALFYCLSRVKEFTNAKFVQEEVDKVINQLFVNKTSLNDVFSKTKLTKEKAEKILSLIQEAVPSFDIQPVTINLSSDCPLVKNLLMTNNHLESPVDNIGLETMKNLVEEQLLLENQFLIPVKAVSKGYPGDSSFECKKKLSDLKKDWRKGLEEALQNALKLRNSKNLQKQTLNVYLNSLPPERIVDIMMEMALNLMEFSRGYSPSTAQCSLLISNKISHHYQIRKKILNKNLDRTKNLFHHYLSWYLKPCGPARNSRHKWQMLIQDSDRTSQLDTDIIKWPEDTKKILGKFLLDLIIKELKFPLEKNGEKRFYPVLCTVLRYREGLWREEIKCHPSISYLFQKIGFEVLSFRADQMPMVCPPKPWKSVDHGGYLLLPSDFIRKSLHLAGKTLRLKDVPLQNMYPTFDALNALQGIPWMINEDVLDVALEVFRKGGSKKLSVPHFPMPVEFDSKSTKNSTLQERMAELIRKKELTKKKFDEYGLWCEALYRLSLANHFRKRFFWLPQNCDFRGRVYPIPALLNHLGADLYRSLLIFAKGKPLGPKGLDWLKIHLINLTGTHKRKTNLERLAYANEILPLILDSAERPLTGLKWWTESDEPWQTLAACMEIKKVLSAPNPEAYICKFPVHQDGSCNGLQHYAGLGKDSIGAESVNLASSKTPQDVYSVVAKLIEKERIKDAEKGIEVAAKLRGFVERKVVKQTVMTTVYGVTHFGAKLQITKRLEDIPGFPQEYVNPAAAYLTDKTFLCLTKMFTSAKEIQEWFLKCADKITSVNDYVQWVSPLGLPVLQSYGKSRVNYQCKKTVIVPDKLKQRNAFPPNFIHCLDSTHMMLTALFCEQAGITFAAVHDCFWTHPSTVDMMNKICREQFISLHSQPVLENLSQFFVRQYLQNNISNNKELSIVFEEIPTKGSFDLKEVLHSVYFFS